jgi:uncharacterized protein YcbK (DUF882 family)
MSAKKFSLKSDANEQVGRNFKLKEFACKDGSDEVLLDLRVVDLLQAIRDHFGKPVTITSGYRTPAYNKKVGGAPDSFHTRGMAADFNVSGVSPLEVRRVIESGRVAGVDPAKIGLGAYTGFTHIDCRGYKGRW